jgi:hypothetical protein
MQSGIRSCEPFATDITADQLLRHLASDGTGGEWTYFADAIQKLAALHAQGILTDDEFAAKKVELLSRM